MPYLRITCAELPAEQRRHIAAALTDTINDLFFSPRARLTREELRERTTVHFLSYASDTLFIGAHTPEERNSIDVTVELSDWNMSIRQQRKVTPILTDALATLFAVPTAEYEGINIRFHSYPPTDFAVGGRLLADVVPKIGQVMKRLLG